MKRVLILLLAGVVLCVGFVGCGSGSEEPTGATHVPYQPKSTTAASGGAVISGTTAKTTRDNSRLPNFSDYPEEITISFVREKTPVTMKAFRVVSYLGYVIYLPEEYSFIQLPGIPEVYRPDAAKYQNTTFYLTVREAEKGSAVPAKTVAEGYCQEYMHKDIGEWTFQLCLVYEVSDTESIRPLLLAMAETITR